ncbi:MAG: ImmA/IrrE family metallo-endopeptidase [Rhizobiales bacterium]|nr:ImmA/IrrE family metallo-endopeptidase [Hyphomicrobiales bacterium]
MTIRAAYRHSRPTAAPARLSAAEVWSVARAVRGQLAIERAERKLELGNVAERVAQLEINDIMFDVAWDLEHEVLNVAGKPVMGVTEYDKASPDCVMVSVNGPMLAGTEPLLRSTIAHELGHVVFDAPGWVRVPPAAPAYSATAPAHKQGDPRETRANEFMGALLVPPTLARIDLQRQAKRQRLPASVRPSSIVPGAIAFDALRLDREAIEEVIFELAERYGVSTSFLRVRLDRYDLLRTGRNWDLD